MSAGLFLIDLCDFEPNTALIKSFLLKKFSKKNSNIVGFYISNQFNLK